MTNASEPLKDALPQVGDLLAGKYRVLRRIGAGGMGVVYEVEHTLDSQHKALKVMLPHLARDAEFATRFMREARVGAMVASEHIARVDDSGKLESGALYMAMELLAGNDLEQELRTRGPLPIAEAVGYVVQACDALAGAHDHNIVHRDLKPANLFCVQGADRTVRVKVLDFGISKTQKLDLQSTDVETLTSTESTLGSPKYMAPEHLRSSKSVDARSDIWSLGVILYRLVSNRLPFEADSLGEYVTMVITEPPTPLPREIAGKAPGLDSIIARCLEKNPRRRYPTVGHLVDALGPFAPDDVREIVARIRNRTADDPPPASVSDMTTVAMAGPIPAPRARPRLRAAATVLVAGGVGAAAAVVFFVAKPGTTKVAHPDSPVESASAPASSAPDPAASAPDAVSDPTAAAPPLTSDAGQAAPAASTARPQPPATPRVRSTPPIVSAPPPTPPPEKSGAKAVRGPMEEHL